MEINELLKRLIHNLPSIPLCKSNLLFLTAITEIKKNKITTTKHQTLT